MSEPKHVIVPPLASLLQNLREGLNEAGISQRELADFLGDNQGNISKKLRGKKPFRIEDISAITSLILERISSLPKRPIGDYYVRSDAVTTVDPDNCVQVAISKMMEGGFTQLPVVDKNTGTCLGILTDFTILKRMLYPNTTSKGNWLQEFRELKVKNARIIDEAPIYPLKTPVAEIAQALLFHYAILIVEQDKKIGIVTRADLMKILL